MKRDSNEDEHKKSTKKKELDEDREKLLTANGNTSVKLFLRLHDRLWRQCNHCASPLYHSLLETKGEEWTMEKKSWFVQ